MTRMSLPLSLILFGLMLSPMPSAAVEKLNCPFIFTSVTPSMLERIRALLPDANAMGSVGRLNSTIDTLRREGMAKSQIVSHLVVAYCPMVAQENSLTEAEKAARVGASLVKSRSWSTAWKAGWTSSSMYRLRRMSSTRSMSRHASRVFRLLPGSR